MTAVPPSQCIYHITHVKNLPAIIASGGLLSDQLMIQRGGPASAIGMSKIKQRRLGLQVTTHPGTYVGEYVPFYFCPRSVMLYILHCRNHPELDYSEGQGPIVHLEADLMETIDWANANKVKWAFSLSNAGAFYASFRSKIAQLSDVNWSAVHNTDFRTKEVKEGKQAEFLVHRFVPWTLIRRIGVQSVETRTQVYAALNGTGPSLPSVAIMPTWYY